jgi:hypothetical protein
MLLHHRQQIARLWTGLVLVTALLLGAWPGTAAAQAATIRIEPPQVRGEPGQDLRVQIVIEDVENLGFFQFDLTFDPAVVQFKSVALGEFLASTGREATAVGPLTDNEQGRLTFGAFTVGDQAGPDGSGVLAEVTLTGVDDGATALSLSGVQLLTAPNNVIVAIVPGQAIATIGNPGTPAATPRATPTSPATTPGTAPPAATSTATTHAQGAATPGTPLPAATSSAAPAQGAATPDSASFTSTPGVASPTLAIATLVTQQPTGSAAPVDPAAGAIALQPTSQATDEPTVALAATGSAGAAETSTPEAAQPAATLAATEPSPMPSTAATLLVRPAADGAGASGRASTEAPRWLLVVGAGALALAGLIAVAIIVLVRRPGS